MNKSRVVALSSWDAIVRFGVTVYWVLPGDWLGIIEKFEL